MSLFSGLSASLGYGLGDKADFLMTPIGKMFKTRNIIVLYDLGNKIMPFFIIKCGLFGKRSRRIDPADTKLSIDMQQEVDAAIMGVIIKLQFFNNSQIKSLTTLIDSSINELKKTPRKTHLDLVRLKDNAIIAKLRLTLNENLDDCKESEMRFLIAPLQEALDAVTNLQTTISQSTTQQNDLVP